MLARFWNRLWAWKCQGEAAAFERACKQVRETQAELLQAMIRDNRETAFGQDHAFARIRTVADYQQAVPVAAYESFKPYIARIAAGEAQVLTRDPVKLFEPTSGTTSGEKLIPYTKSLREQFQRGIASWIADLFRTYPQAAEGRAYWSVSPAAQAPRRTAGGIPIGFDDDTAYLGSWEQWALRFVLAVPASVSRLESADAARYAAMLHLLAAHDLSLISVWNPTFLTSLLGVLRVHSDQLTTDLRSGRIVRCPTRRVDEVARLLKDNVSAAELYQLLWPQLALISCWTDAAAAHFVPQLRSLFPHVTIQPKGLLATEGFVSVPWARANGAALAIRSHFFEFLESGSNGAVRLADEVEIGGRYHVLLTTGGGLYRYNLGDEVQITGRVGGCPVLTFLGRNAATCDLVGEKLSESHVAAALAEVFQSWQIAPTFVLLAPALDSPPHYVLYLQGTTETLAARIGSQLELRLRENPYYRHAVEFGQLGPLEVVLLGEQVPAALLFEQRRVEQGQKAGNIKPAVLDRNPYWAAVFRSPGSVPAGGSCTLSGSC